MPMRIDGPRDRHSPEDEIERVDLQVQLAGLDEWDTMFDPETHPTPPDPAEEAVTTMDGRHEIDLMSDTPPIEGELLRDADLL